MRVAYYINDRLLQLPIRHVYFLPFGEVMHLNEALGVNPLLEPVVCLHEQTYSIASHVFGKLINSPSASLVISGLRSINGMIAAPCTRLASKPCTTPPCGF